MERLHSPKKAASVCLTLALLAALLPLPAQAAEVQISGQKLKVDGLPVDCEKYNIDGSNYFKLRDVAYLLDGTGSQFAVGWDAAAQTITVTTGEGYTPVGGELEIGADNSASAQPSAQKLVVDGVEHTELSAYNIGGSNYFKLRDLGTVLDIYVYYDAGSNTAIIDSVFTDYAAQDAAIQEYYQKAKLAYNSGDFEEAVVWFRKGAEAGDAEAQYWLGWCYDFGKGFAEDTAQAAEWYRKAAEQGNVFAQYRLGEYYFSNAAGKSDFHDQAAECFRKAAIQGYAPAQYMLAFVYYAGMMEDYEQAFEWYRKAAEQGYPSAQQQLGLCYQFSRGVARDYFQAAEWYNKAIENGVNVPLSNLAECYNMMGMYYYKGAGGVTQSYSKAVELYRAAAELGNVTAHFNLGMCYYNGKGVTQDYAQAAEWFKLAAEQGYTDAVQYYQAAMNKLQGNSGMTGRDILDALTDMLTGGSGNSGGSEEGTLSDSELRRINEGVVIPLMTDWKNNWNKNHPNQKLLNTKANTLVATIKRSGSVAIVTTEIEYWFGGGSSDGSVYATVTIDLSTGDVLNKSIN